MYCNGSLLPKGNLILQHTMYCNFTTVGNAAPLHTKFATLYGNSEKLLYNFTSQYLDCNFTLRFANKITLQYCKITKIFNSIFFE